MFWYLWLSATNSLTNFSTKIYELYYSVNESLLIKINQKSLQDKIKSIWSNKIFLLFDYGSVKALSDEPV